MDAAPGGMRWLAVVLLVCSLAGCTDDGPGPSDGPTGTEGQTGTQTGDGSEPVEPGNVTDPPANETQEPRDPVTWTVTIRNNAFQGGTLTVQQGDTVRWVHEDGTVPHTVTADDGSFDSGPCPGTTCMTEFANSEFSETFGTLGEFSYFCQMHPTMTGKVTVLEVYLEEP